jgi:ribonucleoside-diphosphate reductase beta chain
MENMTSSSLYTPKYIDFKHEPLFCGEGKNTQRFDDPKYPFFDNNNDTQQGNDWKHDEIPLVKDAREFKNVLSYSQQYITTKTLQRLIFLDSLQGRGPVLILGQITTLPELENVILTWTYFEGAKHSRTYTEILRALYAKPEEIFDESFDIPELQAVAKSIATPYEDAYFNVINYIYKTQRNIKITKSELHELYDSLIMCIVEINILEGMRFYAGFASMWGMTEAEDIMKGVSDNLSLICRDENTHLALTQMLIKLIKTDESNGLVERYKLLEDKIYDRYLEAFSEEMDWIDFSFLEGSYIGMNSEILKQYLSHITIKRMKAIGFHPTKEELLGYYNIKNPIPWVDKFINMDLVEKLPMTEKITNYITGGVKNEEDISKDSDIQNLL